MRYSHSVRGSRCRPGAAVVELAVLLPLLVFLFVMNGLAIYLRKKFERRW